MRVRVLYFGVLRDVFGGSEEEVEVPEGTAVGEFLRILRHRTSNHSMEDIVRLEEPVWLSLAVAVNREYGTRSIVLRDGDEVALLPPVSGGYCARRKARSACKGNKHGFSVIEHAG